MKKFKDVIIMDKKSVYIEESVVLGRNVIIYPNNYINGNTIIGDGTTLLPNNCIFDCIIGENCSISCSYLEKSTIGNYVSIGPFARLRPNSEIKDNCHLGNFVEVKNSTLLEGTKAGHLAYIGDADIGKNVNVGCGAIFVNYNGRVKNRTLVGDNAFIGSNVNLIAPTKIANNTYIAAGATVTDNTNEYDFVIGRVKPIIKSQKAKKYLKETK